MSSQKYISDTLKRRKQKNKKIKVYAILFLVVLLLCGLVYVSRLPKFQITETQISGLKFLETHDIQKHVDEQLSAYVLWFIPRSNIFLFSKKELNDDLYENPAISSVKISKNFFNTLEIEIEEHKKQSLYCINDLNEECYYINQEGMVYGQVDEYVTPEQEIIFYVPYKKIELKDTLIETDLYKTVFNFIKSADQLQIKIGKVYLQEDGIIELKTRNGITLKTSIFDNFEKDFLNLTALFEKEILDQNSFENVEYIDLRFGNKVFYKNKTN